MHSLRLYSNIPRGVNKFFWTLHSDANKVCVAHILQCASVTLGLEGACPNTNFIRKLFGTLICAGAQAPAALSTSRQSTTWQRSTHIRPTMARTIHYNVSDRIKGGIIKKSVRSFYAVMGAMPIGFPLDSMTDEEFASLLGNMGKRGVKRRRAVGEEAEEVPAFTPRDPEDLNRQRVLQEAGNALKAEHGVDSNKNWMYHHLAANVTFEGEPVTYNQVRHDLKGK